jgi:hypothetical protein
MRQETAALERELVALSLNHLSPAAIQRWEACKAGHRYMAYNNKCLVIYNLLFDEPYIVDKLFCEMASFNLEEGMTSRWRNLDGKILNFSSKPIEVQPSIFLWHTYLTDLQYLEHKGQFSGRFSMLYRCPHHPKIKRDNYLYIQELASYEAEFNA